MPKKRPLALAFIVLALWCGYTVSLHAADFKVIVHRSNPASSMNKDELSRLFLKKTTKWTDGRAAQPVDLPNGSSTRSSFSKSVHGKSVDAVEAYWQRLVFSGRAVPPSKKASAADIVKFVQTTPGAVGYVPSDASVGNCKVLIVR